MKRRQFTNLFLGGSLLGTLAALAYPVIRFLIPPQKSDAGVNSVAAAKTDELAPGTSKIFRMGSTPGILVRTSDGDLKAFSAICTHLTCTVIFEGDTETLFCPCHNGRFDLNGRVMSGPPPTPLEEFEVQVASGEIIVSKKGSA